MVPGRPLRFDQELRNKLVLKGERYLDAFVDPRGVRLATRKRILIIVYRTPAHSSHVLAPELQ